MSLLSSSQIEARSSIHQIQTPQPLIGLIPFYSPFLFLQIANKAVNNLVLRRIKARSFMLDRLVDQRGARRSQGGDNSWD
jgi:hypothetical protein